jgi:hypothetical protein
MATVDAANERTCFECVGEKVVNAFNQAVCLVVQNNQGPRGLLGHGFFEFNKRVNALNNQTSL